MFHLRRETDYAIQLLQYLRSKNGYSSLKDFAEESDISFWFLQKIARKLNKAKIIVSGHGVNGGYKLNILPKKFNLKILLSVMEGDLALTPCIKENSDIICAKKPAVCPVRKIMMKLNKEICKCLVKVKIV
jgi:Rrf2 family nitric oxide-sensitive transcriptional repressor